MELFISWSGPRSHGLAMVLYEWIPEVIQQAKPWISSEDIYKGQRWGHEIGSRLESGTQGVICLTPENVGSAWLNFEAGALAKSLVDGHVRPLLLGLSATDVTGPLSLFQSTVATDRDDMFRLVTSLNTVCTDPLEETRLVRAFERTWDEVSEKIGQVLSTTKAIASPTRTVEDVLSEILERVRDTQRRLVPTRSMPLQRSKSLFGRRYEQLVFTELASLAPVMERDDDLINFVVTWRGLEVPVMVRYVGTRKISSMSFTRLASVLPRDTLRVLIVTDAETETTIGYVGPDNVRVHVVSWPPGDNVSTLTTALDRLVANPARRVESETGEVASATPD